MNHLAYLLEETQQPDIIWLLWAALGFFFLMVFVGWLSSLLKKAEKPSPTKKSKRVSSQARSH